MNAEFAAIFGELRNILEKHAEPLTVAEDSENRYCLTGGTHPKHKTPMPIAWVEIGQNYVSLHHMGIYGCPKLRDALSPRLKARMQGKSCFNFKARDAQLFQELDTAASDAFAAFRTAGYLA